jgi:predicted TIM-barrel fold metal-dependent hydrolase
MNSLNFKPRVPVIDANVRVGHPLDGPSPCSNREQLLTEMDRHGVQRAIIYHAQTENPSPIDGNEQLHPWLDKNSRLIPQWSVMPVADSLAQIKALHAAGRVSSVRLHDTRPAGLPFRPWAYDPLLSWLSENGIPAWIPLPDADAHELVTTLQAYPDLVSVLLGAHYVHTLWVRPVLRAVPNAFLELSRYEPIGELEALRDEFGAARLIYGSWYARYVMGPMLYYLHQTSLSDEELALICAGNVERLLELEAGDD